MNFLGSIYWALVCWDLRLVIAAKTLVGWLVEWFSVQQNWIEKGLIVVSAIILLVHITFSAPAHPFTYLFGPLIGLVICFAQIRIHRLSGEQRFIRLVRREGVSTRLLMQAWALFIALTPPHIWKTDIPVLAWYLAMLSFEYVAAFSSEGIRGRKRKEAMAKLREGLGPVLTPQPVS